MDFNRIAMPELSPPERLVLASSPGTPPEVLAQLAADGNLQVRRAAAGHVSTPGRVISILVAAGATEDLVGLKTSAAGLTADELDELIGLGEFGRRLAARHPDVGLAILETLAGDPLAAVRLAVASHPKSSAELLSRLCGDEDAQVRVAAGQHPRTPREIVERLVAAGSLADLSGYASEVPGSSDAAEPSIDLAAVIALGPWGKRLVARHPLADFETLQTLASDADWAVRAAMAENPSADPSLLSALADLDTFAVKLKVAQHTCVSPAVLSRIAEEPDTRLRVAVASNPQASSDLLQRLACDGSSAVRRAVAEHPGYLKQDRARLVALGSTPDLLGFAQPDPQVDPMVIDEVAEWGGWGCQLAARHPRTSHETLARLMTSGDAILREAALNHPACPRDIVALLRDAGSSDDLQGYASASRSLSLPAIRQLMNLGPWARRLCARHAETNLESLRELVNDLDPQIRRAVARHPRADHRLLDTLAEDVSHEVRWALVGRVDCGASALATLLRDPLATIRLAAVDHPATPREALSALRFDLDEDVRTAVKSRLAGDTAVAPS